MSIETKRSLGPSTALYPVPAVLVTCGDMDSEKNAITLAWVGTASSEPPCVTIGVRPTRYSFGLIQRYGDFVINLPRRDQVGCSNTAGRSRDGMKTSSKSGHHAGSGRRRARRLSPSFP